MRILLIVHGFPPDQQAGSELQAYRIARGLQARGHQTQVVAVESVRAGGLTGTAARNEIWDGVPVDRVSVGISHSSVPLEWEFNNPLVYEYLRELLSRQHFDLLHLVSGYRVSGSALQAAEDSAVPSVVMPMDFWFFCPRIKLVRATGELCTIPPDPLECVFCLAADKRRYRLPQRLSGGLAGRVLVRAWRRPHMLVAMQLDASAQAIRNRRAYLAERLHRTGMIVVNSQFLSRVFMGQGLPADRITVIRQGLDRVSGVEPSARHRHDGVLQIGYIGQIAAHKGVELLVRAFRRLPARVPARLLLYGDYERAWRPFVNRLQHTISADQRIELRGRFEHSDFPRVLSEIDVLVVPSLWYENSPNVILEAFACSTPVIASDLGGMAELVEHDQNGYLFPVGDSRALAKALEMVISNQEILERWRRQIPLVKTVEQEVDELLALYERIIR